MQHRLLDEYVAEITPRRATETETNLDAEELAQHLAALADAHSELGLTDDEAAREAIRQFGVARDVRHELKRASLRNRWVRWTRTDWGLATLMGTLMSLPTLHATLVANYVTPPHAVVDMLAHPETTVVVGGDLWHVTALVAGAYIGARRGWGASAVLPTAIVIGALLPFVVMFLLTHAFTGTPFLQMAREQSAAISFSHLWLFVYTNFGLAGGAIWRRTHTDRESA